MFLVLLDNTLTIRSHPTSLKGLTPLLTLLPLQLLPPSPLLSQLQLVTATGAAMAIPAERPENEEEGERESTRIKRKKYKGYEWISDEEGEEKP